MKRRLTAKQALNHPWIKTHIRHPQLNGPVMRQLSNVTQLDDFQHLCMLILCELLSLADHEFVTEAKEQFIAINTGMSGEITFSEFD